MGMDREWVVTTRSPLERRALRDLEHLGWSEDDLARLFDAEAVKADEADDHVGPLVLDWGEGR